MVPVRITVVERTFNEEASRTYAVPGLGLCEMHTVGHVYVSDGWNKPEGLCESAWQCMQHFVFTLSHGGGAFFKDWMKDKNIALISCNDGCRPVLFLVERMDQE